MLSDVDSRLLTLPPFSGLVKDDLKKIASRSLTRDYSAGEFIIHEGDEIVAAYFLLSGRVEVLRMSLAGREQVLALLTPGQGFNLAPFLLPEQLNAATVRAVADSQMLMIPAVHFLVLMEQLPTFNRLVMHEYAQRLKSLTTRVEELGLYSVRARLVRFLLEQADRHGSSQHWTQEEIARHIGTVRDVVGRCLRSLESEGLIQLKRQHIRLLDRAALKKIAESE
jgi:CRP/FNR family transcriptional regulator, cyclic AMP receptor protein